MKNVMEHIENAITAYEEPIQNYSEHATQTNNERAIWKQ